MSDLYDYFYRTLGSHYKAEEAMRKWEQEKEDKEADNDLKSEETVRERRWR